MPKEELPRSARYVFDNAAVNQTSRRFDALAALYDPGTIRYIRALGVRRGWHCLEVGPGIRNQKLDIRTAGARSSGLSRWQPPAPSRPTGA